MYAKIMKHFYGITGPLDEYKRGEINRLGNNVILLSYGGFNLFVLMGAMTYLGVAAARLHLTDYEVTAAQLPHARWALLGRTLLMGLAFTVLFHLLSIFMAWLDGAGRFGQLLGLPANLKNSLVAGGVWTLLMLGVAWHRLKVIDD
ncbi:DUF3278 domain-containing protein [Limosilactobacillus ingluviei]